MSARKYQELRDKMTPLSRARGFQMAEYMETLQADLIRQLSTDRTNTDLLMLLGYYTFRIAELRA